ncbi:LysE family translocator [Stutzerimonas nitrititolerans]|uniref:LysE family translocator n=1 Tax=Stutzerimonas nitrititolerans TaxID=2482751 RepID=UPI000F7B3849|nr:LysE family translocator [Stutzerimonas nitrititolerans]RRV19895.1 LysE family translocator [Pseudomonas sp. s199]
MPSETLLAFITYAFVTSVTPGPNNTMLLASGLNYGFVRSLPHVLGISIGFAVMVMGVGAGLGRLFEAYPSLYTVLRIVGGAYLMYLAWQIATAAPMGDASAHGRPFGFWKAAAFQWVNPKAWIMAIGAITAYLPVGGGMQAVVVLSLLFALVNAPSVTVWVTFGTTLRLWLTDLRHLRIFNVSMAIMLVLSLYPLLFG